MFLTGLIAFFQTVFFPGYLFLRYTGVHHDAGADDSSGHPSAGKLRTLVYAFGLSLLINYLAVFVFTFAGICYSETFYLVLLVEVSLAVYYWKYRCRPAQTTTTLHLNRTVAAVRNYFIANGPFSNILVLLSLAVLLLHIFYFFYFLGTIFEHWDPLVNWNKYAIAWSANHIPTQTWHYPQLIPANWSVSYLIMQQSDVQFFARAIMPLFSIAIILLFLDLGLRKKNSLYFLALILFGLLLNLFYDPSFIVSGYVDIAVSFFAFLAFYVLHSRPEKSPLRSFKTLWLAVVFASAAAVTKQAGIFILIVILVQALRELQIRKEAYSLKKIKGAVSVLVVTTVIITASWYLLKEIQIRSGAENSEIVMVQGANKSTRYTERFSTGIERLATYRHPKLKPIIYLLLLFMVLGVAHKKTQMVTLLLTLPYFLLWGFFFSYDNRNLAFVVPFIALSAAGGADFLKTCLPDPNTIPPLRIPFALILLALMLTVAGIGFRVTDQVLIREQLRQVRALGNGPLNERLYRFHKQEGIKGKIATNYAYLKFLPGLQEYYRPKTSRITVSFLEYLNTGEGKDIYYLLMPMILPFEADTDRYFREKLARKEYRLIFRLGTYQFVQVRGNTGKE